MTKSGQFLCRITITSMSPKRATPPFSSGQYWVTFFCKETRHHLPMNDNAMHVGEDVSKDVNHSPVTVRTSLLTMCESLVAAHWLCVVHTLIVIVIKTNWKPYHRNTEQRTRIEPSVLMNSSVGSSYMYVNVISNLSTFHDIGEH